MSARVERVFPPAGPLAAHYFDAEEPEYPGFNCRAHAGCKSCPRWRCTRCKKLRPWCVGSSDPHGGWCAGCYSKHLRSDRTCSTCGDRREPRRSTPETP